MAAFLRHVEERLQPEEPFFAHKRLERVFARMDHYADFGRGREGAGLEFATAMVDAHIEECRWGRVQRPRSAAYFIPLLEEVSKSWRRKSAEREETAPPGWRSSWAPPKRKKGRRRGGNHGAGERSTEGA
ncbi:MAG TPA: hypothetical protein VFI17_03600 [Solirubrobacterales bacterium]|nr:hypothetical protein [Solirubrobacterales bacterium]